MLAGGVIIWSVFLLGACMKTWFLYLARCADGTLYTGITTDLEQREADHNAGRGARYTRARRPVKVVAAWRCGDRPTALRAELSLRRLSHQRKLSLIAQRAPFKENPFCAPSEATD
jgi:putative endonuclease